MTHPARQFALRLYRHLRRIYYPIRQIFTKSNKYYYFKRKSTAKVLLRNLLSIIKRGAVVDKLEVTPLFESDELLFV
jgi:hypothetical protein